MLKDSKAWGRANKRACPTAWSRKGAIYRRRRQNQSGKPPRAESGGESGHFGVRLQVERQTHLPANRQEAWQALQTLLPASLWESHAAVFAALESIYRVESQQMGEQLQAAYRAANEAVEEIPAYKTEPSKSAKRTPKEEKKEVDPAVDAFRNDVGAAGTTLRQDDSETDEISSSDETKPQSNGQVKNKSHHAHSRQGSGNGKPKNENEGESKNKRGHEEKGAERRVEEEVNYVVNEAGKAVQSAFTALQGKASQANGSNASGDRIDVEKTIDLDATNSIDESEIIALASVDYESASRLAFDRSQRRNISLTREDKPKDTDHRFMTALIPLLRKASFVNLSSRDDALATSLNADYVAQLFISPDTTKLDRDLVHPTLKELDVPELAQSILIFKRGYGQARRKGRMLVAKLDYLQYIVVRSVTSNVVAIIKRGWSAVSGRKKLQSGKDKVDVSEKSLKPESGRMPNTAGQGESDGGANDAENGHDLSLWENIQKLGKSIGNSKNVSPRFLVAGGGLFMTLSNWGLLPQVDVEPLGNFKSAWKPDEPSRLDPIYVERTSLRDALAAKRGLNPETILGTVELVEPTFQELLVVYRQKPKSDWFAPIRQKLLGPKEEEQSARYRRRSPILLRIFRDVPLPTWKIVFPDKLLQFRPLDGLRADLLTVSGIVAFIAQAKYDSIILELITLSSAIALLVRVTLGYKRMYDRFEKMANEILAETTIAGQEGVITYLANSAALQQFEQTSLAYLSLIKSDKPLDEEGLCSHVEQTLNEVFQVKVRFDAGQALKEVERLGLAQKVGKGYKACSSEDGLHKLKNYWTKLLMPPDLEFSEPNSLPESKNNIQWKENITKELVLQD